MKEGPVEHKHASIMDITATMEDYLKVIFDLDKTKKMVRVKDIANRLGVKMSSVTSMLKKLAKYGLVRYRKYEYVELEETGADFAQEVCKRHMILVRFLSDILTVDKKTAAKEACKMEHLISLETLGNLNDFMNFVESCPNARVSWPVRFKTYRENGCRLGICKQSGTNAAKT
ncbi:metal-dependent transcriptional regulator [uncultured Desulfosarcina sp.]|uniref:metal-dependent transcriptional regulator n=1 Tax=uncultured Desulfosarcina sp. TaxID=218289 RepID=UPI0029C86D8B|nr:metal-dependent transcriptional regulator [uncultured Desulfosarcina sp.]